MNATASLFSRRPRGFTLLELLVALTISAILAMSLFASLHVVFKARENSLQALAPVGGAELALDMIKTDLQAALPEAPSTSTSQGGLQGGISTLNTTATPLIGPFEGTQGGGQSGGDALYFYSTGYSPPHQSGVGEVKQIGLMLEQKNNTLCLVRQVWTNLLSLQAQNLAPDEEVICRYVNNFTLQYYDGTQWVPSWDSTQYNNSLPVAVMIDLDYKPPSVKDPIHLHRVVALSCLTPPTAVSSGTQSQ